ncbi:MAG: cell filamentation protein Fic [Bacteroidales bacterium 36-12]|nr:MAG: cell filamentation protein Fic [Bacteroidales bacterium 36-12]
MTLKKLSIKNSTIQFLAFVSEKGGETVDITFQNGDLWASEKVMSALYGIDRSGIARHIKNIFADGELDEKSTCAIFAQMGNDDKQTYHTRFYNLDMIISIGYRVNSVQAINFRRWATTVLKEFAKKGYIIDRKRMENGRFFDEDYFEHLLAEIREIRLSERRLYQKVTDIYATSSDYDVSSPLTKQFFATAMNKLHWAVHHNTAAELIYNRVDAQKSNMGLTTWENAPMGKIVKTDVSVAKNYLTTEELESLGRIVNAYLDLAEDRAKKGIPMTMKDWATRLDRFLLADDRDLLKNAGKISAKIAKDKAESEFEKYRVIQDKTYMSDFDKLLEQAKFAENK